MATTQWLRARAAAEGLVVYAGRWESARRWERAVRRARRKVRAEGLKRARLEREVRDG